MKRLRRVGRDSGQAVACRYTLFGGKTNIWNEKWEHLKKNGRNVEHSCSAWSNSLLCMKRIRRVSFTSFVCILSITWSSSHADDQLFDRVGTMDGQTLIKSDWSTPNNIKLYSNTNNLKNKMEGGTYFFVEHDITDKQGWDGWMSSWSNICGKLMRTV